MQQHIFELHGDVMTLTCWGWHKMALLQTTFSYGFSWMEIFDFQTKFHWNILFRVNVGPIFYIYIHTIVQADWPCWFISCYFNAIAFNRMYIWHPDFIARFYCIFLLHTCIRCTCLCFIVYFKCFMFYCIFYILYNCQVSDDFIKDVYLYIIYMRQWM